MLNNDQNTCLFNFTFTLLISVICSIFSAYLVSSSLNKKIVTIDLGKILFSQSSMAGRNIANDRIKPWMSTIKEASKDLRHIIAEIAGKNTLVIVSPAVVQGAANITNTVLAKLNLPTNVPEGAAPINATLQHYVVTSVEKNTVPDWLLP